jgi:hypothetical protein
MRLWCAWVRYWFRAAPLFDLAFVRLVAVGFQLGHLATIRPRTAFGELAALPDSMYAPVLVLRLLVLPIGGDRPSEDVVVATYWMTLAVGVFAFIGYRTTLSLVLFTVGNVFLQAFEYSFQEIHHAEAIVIIALALLALAPSGRTLSLDDILLHLRAVDGSVRVPHVPLAGRSYYARWPLLLLQWMFALIYLSAVTHKLKAAGFDWMNGWTLQYYMLQDGMRWGSGLGVWIGHYHSVALIASWISVFFEATFWLVLVVPRLALVFLPVGIGFHLAVYAIQRAPFFSFIVMYSVFIPWRDVFRRTGTWLGRYVPRPLVQYDPNSPHSVRRAMLIRYFDWFGLTVLSPRSAAAELRP